METIIHKEKNNRFVLFIDILGFKDLVSRNTHTSIIKKLNSIRTVLRVLESEHKDDNPTNRKFEKDRTKSITFSDSIIVFSESNTEIDALKILVDAHVISLHCLRNSIPVKGAISYGQISVDYENSLFFGQAIIDAYLLHEQLNLLSIVVDHHAEKKFRAMNKSLTGFRMLSEYEVPMTFGKVNHRLLRPSNIAQLKDAIKDLQKLYSSVSGRPRLYIDNTLKFYNSLLEK